MKNKKLSYLLLLNFLTVFASCSHKATVTVTFDLHGGHFDDPNFDTTSLKGKSGDPIKTEIPNPKKDGYYFVGWRELKKDNSYGDINKKTEKDGKEYYHYPAIDFTFHAYFEPLAEISFSVGDNLNFNATIEKPILGSQDFNNNKLSGYTNKKILSTDYLPTCNTETTYMHFSYWYSKYPLKQEDGENGIKKYTLDTSAEAGIYQFDKLFGSDNMVFPQIEGDFTLYAYFTEDPKLNLHFNLSDVTDTTIHGSNNRLFDLKNTIHDTLGFDYSSDNERYYYPMDTKRYRFAGCFTDSDFKTQINFDSYLNGKDIDIYFKWEEKVSINLDFDSGTYNSQSSLTISDPYYQNDILGNDFPKTYKPNLSLHTFVGYYDQNDTTIDPTDTNTIKMFDYNSPLTNTSYNLKAYYVSAPKLTLKYDFPKNYSNPLTDPTPTLVEYESELSGILSNFRNTLYINTNGVTSPRFDDIISSVFYTPTDPDEQEFLEEGDIQEYEPLTMPDNDVTLFLRLLYRPKVTLVTYYGDLTDPTSYQDGSTTIPSETDYFDSSTNSTCEKSDCILDDSWYSSKSVSSIIGGKKYMFDGIYNSNDFDNENEKTIFPLAGLPEYKQCKIYNLYRKLSESITLTFKNKTDNSLIKAVDVIKGKNLSEIKDNIVEEIGNFSKLFVKDQNNNYHEINEILPKTNSDIYVEI